MPEETLPFVWFPSTTTKVDPCTMIAVWPERSTVRPETRMWSAGTSGPQACTTYTPWCAELRTVIPQIWT